MQFQTAWAKSMFEGDYKMLQVPAVCIVVGGGGCCGGGVEQAYAVIQD